MKNLIALLILNVITFNGYSQTFRLGDQSQIPDSEKVFVSVEEMPEFPGGEEGMMKYIQTNIVYPPSSKENDIQGTVYIGFVINKEGNVENAEVVKGVKDGNELDIEALRIIKAMPTWKPGKQNGNRVKVQFVYPVKFVVINSSISNKRHLSDTLYNLKVVDSDDKNITYTIINYKKESTDYFYNEGVKCFEKLKYKTAIDLFQAALSITNNDVDALYNCGVCYSKLNDFENACKCWHKIKAMNLNDANQLIKDNCK